MLWLWVLPFVLQALLLGIIMYTVRRCLRCSHCRSIAEGVRRTQLVVLSELETDQVNPHDCAAKLNKLVVRGRETMPLAHAHSRR
jgi:hypothetical protein